MLGMVNFVFIISAFMVSTSRWGSDSVSGDDGCVEKVIDLWIKTNNPPPWPWGTVLTYSGVIPDAGVLGF